MSAASVHLAEQAQQLPYHLCVTVCVCVCVVFVGNGPHLVAHIIMHH